MYKELVLQELNYYYAHLKSMTHGTTMSARHWWRYKRNVKMCMSLQKIPKRYNLHAVTRDTATIHIKYIDWTSHS